MYSNFASKAGAVINMSWQAFVFAKPMRASLASCEDPRASVTAL
jgi:hypothetical protein